MSEFVIADVLLDISSLPTAMGPLSFKYGPPMLLANGPEQTLRAYELYGIYLLVEPMSEGWDVPLDDYRGSLWYVGKTVRNLHERIKSHFGAGYMSSSFDEHRWRTVDAVPQAVQKCLATGQVVVYPVGLNPPTSLSDRQKELLPEMVEKQLLVRYFQSNGQLPVLNLHF